MRALLIILFIAGIAYAAVGPPPATPTPEPTSTPLPLSTAVPTATPTPAQAPTAEPTPVIIMTPTSTPQILQGTTELKCSELSTARDRIKCRVHLPEENEYDFLPEECRSSKDTTVCLTNYNAVRRCFELDHTDRVGCAKTALSIGNIAQENAKCRNDEDCRNLLRSRVFSLVKFRIYNLEYKAQHLLQKGANETLVLDFIEAAEQKKIEFNEAQTLGYKKVIVQDVIKLWNDFTTAVRGTL